jgi:predicted porin
MWSISGVMPFGQAELHVGWDHSEGKVSGFDKQKVDQFKVTAQYNVSKRTALYTTGSWLKNKDDTSLTLPGAAGLTRPGDDSKGFEIGVRHFF